MTQTNGAAAPPTTAREGAVVYTQYQIKIVPMPARSKDPGFDGWQDFRFDINDLDKHFPEGAPRNIAALNGEPSGGLTDADLDCSEAVKAGEKLLPATGWVFGRKSAPRSHRTYRTKPAFSSARRKFDDPVLGEDDARSVLCELRGSGGITVFPGSTHKKTGELVLWDSFVGAPAEVPLRLLEERIVDVAVTSLLARYWPGRGRRDECFKALTGGLLRGLDVNRADRILYALAFVTDDEEISDRVKKVPKVQERLDAGEPTVGWPTLATLLGDHGEKIVSQVRKWLGLSDADKAPPPWPDPVPLDGGPPPVPPFPIDVLPPDLADFVRCEAEATQTPPDLAGVLALVTAGAGLATKYRIRVRAGWEEPANLFGVVALQSGERKSAVFRDAVGPVQDFESAELDRAAPDIAAAQSEHRQLEARLKHLEGLAAKAKKDEERAQAKADAKEAAEALAGHFVPPEPKLLCDDITPEEVHRLICEQGGRLFQAGPEGTPFEIVKGRYDSNGQANFDVYLKGHAGDPLKSDRVLRGRSRCDSPALSVALAVQPHVIRGLAAKDGLRDRGFLARFLYSIPASLVGRRKIEPRPVPDAVRQAYRDRILALWRSEPATGPGGSPAPHVLELSAGANGVIRELEAWLEPHLADGADLSHLAGWANKLAGASARIAGILHVAGGLGAGVEVSEDTVRSAVRLGRYFLAHAQAAFHMLGVSAHQPLAVKVWEKVRAKVGQAATVSRRDLFVWNRRSFPAGMESLDPVISILVDHGHLRPVSEGRGRGVKGAEFAVNPKAVSVSGDAPRTQRTQRTQPRGEGAETTGKCGTEGSEDPEGGTAHDRTQRTQPGARRGDNPFRGRTQNVSGRQNGRATGTSGTEVVYAADGCVHEPKPAPNGENPAETDGLCTLCTLCTGGEGSGASPSDVGEVPTGPRSAAEAPDTAPHMLVTTPAQLDCVLSAIEEAGLAAIDTETTGLDPARDRVRLLSLALPTTDGGLFAYLIDCFAIDPAPVLGALAGKELVGHNLTFDLCFLARLGFQPSAATHDTLHLSRVLHAGAGHQVRHGLADLVGRELGAAMDKKEQKSDWSGALTGEQLAYAARDVLVLPGLLETLRRKLAEADLTRTAEIETRCLPAVAWMAARGVGIDRAAWSALAQKAHADAARLREQMQAMAPVTPGEMFVSWKWDSPLDMKRLFVALGFEVENADDEALAGIDHPIAGLLREYRGATKLQTTYGEKWLKHVSADGRVYAKWNQTGSEAGRMSCGDPNMQQLPRDKAYRRCVAAPPGRVLIKADYSQIELRIAAKITGDAALLEAYRNGDDLHTRTARQVLGKEEVTKQDRQLAKALNFGLLYGMGKDRFRTNTRIEYGISMTTEEAEAYRRAFFAAYPGLRAWHGLTGQSDQAVQTRTLAGRRRLGVKRFTEKLNTPVQGTGADGLKLALALLWERREQVPGAFPVLAVHDEIVVECDADQAEAVSSWLRSAMCDAMAPLIDPVPVEVEVKVGRTWGGD